MPSSASPPTTYVPRDGTTTIEGLEIRVVDLDEKHDTDGHEVLVGRLRLRASGAETELSFYGDTETPTVWNGYEVRIRGGSKAAIGVAVTRVR